MYYAVKARFQPETAAEFLQILTDGTIARQEPDGAEIVASMKRATIHDDGFVRWSERCFCGTPLAHERETVYVKYFTDFETDEADDYVEFAGTSFFEHLKQCAAQNALLHRGNRENRTMSTDPMSRTKDDFAEIIDHISVTDSPVGIDAKFTHAIIIAYLQQISQRLDHIENELQSIPR